jgi:hypothetical protein
MEKGGGRNHSGGRVAMQKAEQGLTERILGLAFKQ